MGNTTNTPRLPKLTIACCYSTVQTTPSDQTDGEGISTQEPSTNQGGQEIIPTDQTRESTTPYTNPGEEEEKHTQPIGNNHQ